TNFSTWIKHAEMVFSTAQVFHTSRHTQSLCVKTALLKSVLDLVAALLSKVRHAYPDREGRISMVTLSGMVIYLYGVVAESILLAISK
ncbi:MAG: hypothetical protein ACK41Q_12445, partial [Candidatus Brocadia sp.]